MARPNVETHPEAIAEATAAYLWYAERDPTAGHAFMAALDRAVSQILESPERWPLHLHRTRKFLLRRFPYTVIYRQKNNSHPHRRGGPRAPPPRILANQAFLMPGDRSQVFLDFD